MSMNRGHTKGCSRFSGTGWPGSDPVLECTLITELYKLKLAGLIVNLKQNLSTHVKPYRGDEQLHGITHFESPLYL